MVAGGAAERQPSAKPEGSVELRTVAAMTVTTAASAKEAAVSFELRMAASATAAVVELAKVAKVAAEADDSEGLPEPRNLRTVAGGTRTLVCQRTEVSD